MPNICGFSTEQLTTPFGLTRQRVHLDDSGVYQLTGLVRFDGHARPDVALVLDHDSGSTRTVALDLPKLLPPPRYANLELDKPGLEKKQEENLLKDPDHNDNGKWWRFAVTFRATEPGTLGVQLIYHIGLQPPGVVWFDGFDLRPADMQIDQDTVTAELLD